MVLLRLPTHSQDDDGDASDRLVSINIVCLVCIHV